MPRACSEIRRTFSKRISASSGLSRNGATGLDGNRRVLSRTRFEPGCARCRSRKPASRPRKPYACVSWPGIVLTLDSAAASAAGKPHVHRIIPRQQCLLAPCPALPVRLELGRIRPSRADERRRASCGSLVFLTLPSVDLAHAVTAHGQLGVALRMPL